MIRVLPPEDRGPLLRAAAEPEVFDWIVFTSANAVDALMHAVLETGGDVRSLKGPQLCAIGTATAEQLAKYGIKVDLIPPEFRADAVVAALATRGSLDAARVLLPRADIGREVIADQLRESGALVTDVIAYRNVLDDTHTDGEPDIYRMLLDGEIHVVTFLSASAVRNFAKIFGAEQAADLLNRTVVAAIGPVTAEAAARLGINVTVQPASTYTVPALVEAIVAHVTAAKAVVTGS
jgi:uroporphyrinogen III methyltransferase/synthase